MPDGLRCHYLQDAAIELFGLRIRGTPWQPWFHDWAFNAPQWDGEAFLASKFEAIPPDTDIVVAHGPAATATAPARARTSARLR